MVQGMGSGTETTVQSMNIGTESIVQGMSNETETAFVMDRIMLLVKNIEESGKESLNLLGHVTQGGCP